MSMVLGTCMQRMLKKCIQEIFSEKIFCKYTRNILGHKYVFQNDKVPENRPGTFWLKMFPKNSFPKGSWKTDLMNVYEAQIFRTFSKTMSSYFYIILAIDLQLKNCYSILLYFTSLYLDYKQKC